MTIYAAPTSLGVATVACTAPARDDGRFASDCGRVAGTLSVPGARAFALGPSRDYAKRLEGAMARLTKRMDELRPALASADRRAQARLALAAATAHTRARAALGRLELSPADSNPNRRVVGALAGVASGFRRLASAAAGNHRATYRAAAKRVRRAEASLEKALASVLAGGYRGLVTIRYRSRAIPPLATPTPTPTPAPTPTPTPRPTPTPTVSGGGGGSVGRRRRRGHPRRWG